MRPFLLAIAAVAVLAACSEPSVATCSQHSTCPSASRCVQGLCEACPPGRDACGGVLIVTGGVGATNLADVQNTLAATGAFSVVDTLDVATATPTATDLAPYGAVLTFSDAGTTFGYPDPVALGDNLATYFDAGGRVVVATFANTSGLPLGGRFATDYLLISLAPQSQPTDSTLGTIAEPGSPLLAGVAAFAATSAYGSTGSAQNGGVVVASWSDGRPLVVRGTFAGRGRADLNLFPPSSAERADLWTGNGAELMRNALLFE